MSDPTSAPAGMPTSIGDLRTAITARQVSIREIVAHALSRIDEANPSLNAMVEARPEAALREAEMLDDSTDPRCAGPLAGIPFTAKITTETMDLPTTHGSRAFAGARTEFDAVVIARLRAAGAILVGKTNAPELALRSTTENELYGPTRNPWNPAHSPGGSSGGAGAAVAVSMCTVAQGNDAGGSVRIPAACCGVAGFKPSRGRIPWAPGAYEMWGGVATNGLLARTVADIGYALDVAAGPDRGDPYAVANGEDGFYAATSEHAPGRQARIAYCSTPAHGVVTPLIQSAFERAVSTVAENASAVSEDHPSWDGLDDLFITIIVGNAGGLAHSLTETQLSRLEPTTLSLILAGEGLSAGSYCHALDQARMQAAKIVSFWETYDYLVTPTVTDLPPLCTDTVPEDPAERVRRLMDWQPFLYPFNITGQPAMSVPMGRDPETGLPLGLQIVGRPGDDAGVLRQAAMFERAQPWSSPAVPGTSEPSTARIGVS